MNSPHVLKNSLLVFPPKQLFSFAPSASTIAGSKKPLRTKKFICPYCAQGCFDRSHLRRHVMIHTGERPLACNYCNYRTRQTSDLKQHMLQKHTEILSNITWCTIPMFLNHLVLPKMYSCNQNYLIATTYRYSESDQYQICNEMHE